MASSRFIFKWMRLLGVKAAPRYGGALPGGASQPPIARVPRLLTRQEWHVLLLLSYLPVQARDLLEEEVWEVWQWGRVREPLSVSEYTQPGVAGVRRARFAEDDGCGQEVETLSQRLTQEWGLSLRVLQAPEQQLSRTMRSALLAVQGARLGQLWARLAQSLAPQQILEVFRQTLAA